MGNRVHLCFPSMSAVKRPFLSSPLCSHLILIRDTEMMPKCGIRAFRWPAQVVDIDLKLTSFLFFHSSPWWPAHDHVSSHTEFKVSFFALMLESKLHFSPPETKCRNLLTTPSPVPALCFVQSFPVCPASNQLFGLGKAVYFQASIVNRSSRNIDNSMKLRAACPSRTSTRSISMYTKIYPWNLSKREFLILIQNEY